MHLIYSILDNKKAHTITRMCFSKSAISHQLFIKILAYIICIFAFVLTIGIWYD